MCREIRRKNGVTGTEYTVRCEEAEMADGMAIEPVDGKSSPHQSDLSTVLRNHLNGKIRCLPDALE